MDRQPIDVADEQAGLVQRLLVPALAPPLPGDLEQDLRRVYEWWSSNDRAVSARAQGNHCSSDWCDVAVQVIDFLADLRRAEAKGAQPA